MLQGEPNNQRVPKGALFLYAIKEAIPLDLIVRKIPQSDTIKVYPVSDVHLGSILHDKEGWQAFCRRVEQEDAFLILGGDLINNNTRHAVGSPFEDYIRPREQKKMMVEMLTPIKDKILCAVSGNHEARTARDTDQDIMGDIMCKLDLEDYYAEDIAFLKLEIGRRITRDAPITSYTMAVTHGSGGGIYTGATVNRNERFGYTIEGIDALIVGHTHKGTISKPKKIVVDSNNNVIRTKQLVVVSCTAWQHYGGYAARKMLLPSSESDHEQPQTLLLCGCKKGTKRITAVW